VASIGQFLPAKQPFCSFISCLPHAPSTIINSAKWDDEVALRQCISDGTAGPPSAFFDDLCAVIARLDRAIQ
jgi:hypothetical protein